MKLTTKVGLSPQKKLLTIQRYPLVSGCLKCEATSNGTTESLVAENILTDNYLNEHYLLAGAVADNLFNDKSDKCAIDTALAVCNIYKSKPDLANDSLYPFIETCRNYAQIFYTNLKAGDKPVEELAEAGEAVLNEIHRVIDDNLFLTFWNAKGTEKKSLSPFDLTLLEDVVDSKTNQYKNDNENILYVGMLAIDTFWNFGVDETLPKLKNWRGTYILLEKILKLCEWPDNEDVKYDLLKAIKNIRIDEKNSSTYDDSTPALNRQIWFGQKSILTTKDAVILRSKPNQPDDYFTDARRIIHGPGRPMTKKPFIILFKDETANELEAIVEELVKDYPDEFHGPNDSYTVQIFWDGNYFDKRIIWKTV